MTNRSSAQSILSADKRGRRGGFLISAALITLLPAGAWAQAAPSAPVAQPVSSGFGDIVVTAQRREERAQDVPISITALSSDDLRNRKVNKLQDLEASVPSLVVAPNGQASRNVMSPSIRGQSTSFQGAPAVVVYMNEVPLPSGIMFSTQGGPGNFVDLENVQVLSGPQGTLFGRNTTGGAVLLIPARPTDELEGYLSGGYGNYNMTEFEAVLNVPIADEICLRVVGAARDRDGYTYDVNWDKHRDDEQMRMFRVGLDLEPFAGVKNYTLIYYGQSKSNGTGTVHRGFNIPYFHQLDALVPTFDFCKSAGNCDYYTDITAQQEKWGVRKVAHGTDDFAKSSSWGINNTTEIDIGDHVTLRNIVSYAELKSTFANDQDGTIAPVDDTGITGLSKAFPTDYYKLFTEELQFQGSVLDDRLNYTVGGFYSKQSPKGPIATLSSSVCSNPTIDGCHTYINRMHISNKSKAL